MARSVQVKSEKHWWQLAERKCGREYQQLVKVLSDPSRVGNIEHCKQVLIDAMKKKGYEL